MTRVWSCNLSYWRTVYYKTFVSATSEWRIYAPLGTYWGSQTFHLFRTGSGGYNRTSFKQILY
ncbi:MAG TPA: hypothetical protein VGW35_01270 [Methylomirabilota bacterium]|nr:hypothetical protein [Methylomirabilota bacterium]